MKNAKESRRAIRLHFHKGMTVLHAGELPSLGCPVEDLSTGGCRCLVPLRAAGAELAGSWRAYLKPARPVQMDLTVPPHLIGLRLEGEITHVRDVGDLAVDIGIHFIKLTPSLEKKLAATMVNFAVDRLRGDRMPFRITKPQPESDEPENLPLALPGSLQGLRLGEILVRTGKLNRKQLNEVVRKTGHVKLGRVLVTRHLITPQELCHALSIQSGLPVVDLQDREVPGELRRIFKYLQMLRLEFVPFQGTQDMLCVAAAHPLKPQDITELEKTARKRVLVFLAEDQQVHDHVFRLRPKELLKSRRYARYKAALPVYFQFCSPTGTPLDDVLHQGASVDVSEGGFQVEGDTCSQYPASELVPRRLHARIAVHMTGREVHAFCAIRFARELPAEKQRMYPWVYGFEIERISEDDKVNLRDLCIRASINRTRERDSKFT